MVIIIQENQSAEYLNFLNEYLFVLKAFLKHEIEKLEIVTSNNLKQLDSFVNKEQAFLMKTKGLEKQRIEHMAQLGCPELKLRQIIPLVPAGHKDSYEKVYEEFNDTVSELKRVGMQCNTAIQIRLHQIDNIINELDDKPNNQKPYTKEAQQDKDSVNFISKKI